MERLQGNMSAEVLDACLRRMKQQGAQCAVLHHFGEPLLHPELQARLMQIAEAEMSIMFSTNALLLDQCWEVLLSIPATIYARVSVHKWARRSEEDYFRALKKWTDRAQGSNLRILAAPNFADGKYVFHRWAEGDAGSWKAEDCLFIRENGAVVLWNGDIATCCVDHEGLTGQYNILDPKCDVRVSEAWSACASCEVGRTLSGPTWGEEFVQRLNDASYL